MYFQSKGWNVAATMRDPSKETELSKLPNVKCFALEVTDSKSIRSAIEAAAAAFGDVDVLCKQRRVLGRGTFRGDDDGADREAVRREFLRRAQRHPRDRAVLQEARRGDDRQRHLDRAEMGFPLYSVYNASKWALAGFSEAVSYELDLYNIRMKCVEPGIIKTDFYTRSYNLAYDKSLTEVNDFYIGDPQKKIESSAKGASEPIVVAKAIFKAANSRSKKLVYRKGQYSFLPAMKRSLPFGMFKSLIRSNYRVN
jgi:NAD(P)-dependent dehydrogenase (short-subunit alcohol dehydrogenase family)